MAPRIPVVGLALLLGVLSGQTALGQQPTRQLIPAIGTPATTPAPRTEIRIFPLRDTDAAEMVQTLKDLFAGDDTKKIRIALHRSTNSVIVMGEPDDLEKIDTIIARLEATTTEKKDSKPEGKRPKTQKRTEEIKGRVALAQADVEQSKERLAWSERMVKMNYMTSAQAAAEQARFASSQIKLEQILKDLQVAEYVEKAAAAPVWEYKVVKLGLDEAAWEGVLNKAGEDGWELVTTAQSLRAMKPDSTVVMFKRPKR